MAAWVCTGCSTVYAVGAPCCPHCRADEPVEEGTQMPKSTRRGGASNAAAVAPEVAADAVEAEPVVEAPEAAPAADKAPETEAPTTVEGDVAEGGEGTGPEQGQNGATDGATATDGEGAGDEPAVAPKAATRRRTAKG